MPRIPQYRQPEQAPDLRFPQVVEGGPLAAPGRALAALGGAVSDMGEGLQRSMNRQMRLQQQALADRQEQVGKLTKNYWDAEFYRWQGDDLMAGEKFAKDFGDHGIGYTSAESARLEKSINDFIAKVPEELRPDYTEKAMQYRLGRLKGAANDEDRMGNDFAVTSGSEIWERAYAPRLTGDDKADEAVLNEFITTQVENGPGNAGTKEKLAGTVREDYAKRKFAALYSTDPDAAEALATRAGSLANQSHREVYSFLQGRAAGRGVNITKINPDFASRVARAVRDAEAATGQRATFTSGFRSHTEQARLYTRFVTGKGGRAAAPGNSRHERGAALDLKAGPVLDWIRANASQYGLEFLPDRLQDPGHVQMAKGVPATAPAGPPSPAGADQPQWASWLPADEARAFVSERKKEAEIEIKAQREDALKDIYDAAYKGEPIDQMLEERRDLIPAADYGRLKGLAARQRKEIEGEGGSPDRAAYADLLQRAVEDDDQGEVQDDAIDAYRQGYISRTDLNKLFSLSRNATSETLSRPWAREVRKTLSSQLRPASVAEPEQYERRMQAVFALDDWMRENPKASRDEAVKKAKELATEFATQDVADLRRSLPMPYGATIGRYAVSQEQLPLSAALLREAHAKKKISEEQFRQQVEVLRKWKAMLDEEARSGQP
jgi:D-alanyl-D-alanine carboxypeptidase